MALYEDFYKTLGDWKKKYKMPSSFENNTFSPSTMPTPAPWEGGTPPFMPDNSLPTANQQGQLPPMPGQQSLPGASQTLPPIQGQPLPGANVTGPGDGQATPQTPGSVSSLSPNQPSSPMQSIIEAMITHQFPKKTGFQDPATQALLQAGLSIMATPPRREPYGDLEVLGRGGLAGLQGAKEQYAANTAEDTKTAMQIMTAQKEQDTVNYRASDLKIKQQRADQAGGGSGIAPLSADKYTPQSLSKYQQSKNMADLVPVAVSDNKNQSLEQLVHDSLFSTDPIKGEQAKKMLQVMKEQKLLTPEQEAQQIRIAKTKSENAGVGGQFKEGTLDYMVEKYETDGTIPPFGMGQVGAKQRAAFFDKASDRAKSRGDTGGAQAIRGMEFKSNQSTLTDLTKREQLINSFKVRIDATSNQVLIPLIKKWDLQNPRFANLPVNKLAEIMGSGDLASLKLALNSVSVEVGKVEFNALGIQQLSDSAAKFMKDIHDENMPVKDILKVIKTSQALGKTGADAISNQRKELVKRTKEIAPGQSVSNYQDFDIKLPGNVTAEDIVAELNRRKKK